MIETGKVDTERLRRREGEASRRRRQAHGRVLHRRLGRGQPAEPKLSNESPVGKAIIGKKKGETVEVTTPRGSLKYKILDIKRRSAHRTVGPAGRSPALAGRGTRLSGSVLERFRPTATGASTLRRVGLGHVAEALSDRDEIEVRARADEVEPGATDESQQFRLAGRVLARRELGKITFSTSSTSAGSSCSRPRSTSTSAT